MTEIISSTFSDHKNMKLEICLQLRSWCQGSLIMTPVYWDQVPHRAPCSVGSLLLSLPLPFVPAHACSLTKYFFKDFIYLFDKRDSQREREHKQREWERKKQAPSGRAWRGVRSQNVGITPWAKGRRLTTEPHRRPNKHYILKEEITRENRKYLEMN